MDVIDTAFQSRVDFIIHYDHLTSVAREEVWRNLIQLAGLDKIEVSDKEIRELSELKLNGREIKNLVKSALVLDAEGFGKVGFGELQDLAQMRIKAQKILG